MGILNRNYHINPQCVHLTSFITLFSYVGGRMQAFSPASKPDHADFTYWMSFLPSNLIKEISSNTDDPSANT